MWPDDAKTAEDRQWPRQTGMLVRYQLLNTFSPDRWQPKSREGHVDPHEKLVRAHPSRSITGFSDALP